MKIKAMALAALTAISTVSFQSHQAKAHDDAAVIAGAIILGLGAAAIASHKYHRRHNEYRRSRHYETCDRYGCYYYDRYGREYYRGDRVYRERRYY